jgi:hypothetical protein
MASANQVLDMSPVGMIFTVLKSAADTQKASLDLGPGISSKCQRVLRTRSVIPVTKL